MSQGISQLRMSPKFRFCCLLERSLSWTSRLASGATVPPRRDWGGHLSEMAVIKLDGLFWWNAWSAMRNIAFQIPGEYHCSMKKIWVNRARSFEEAQDFDNAYYLSLSSSERVESVQFLREEYIKSHGLILREDGKRLRRVFRIIKQA